MNTKLISAILGTVAICAPLAAQADDATAAPAKTDAAPAAAPVKAKKAKAKKADAMKKADDKGGAKSCSGSGADGKSCSGK